MQAETLYWQGFTQITMNQFQHGNNRFWLEDWHGISKSVPNVGSFSENATDCIKFFFFTLFKQ